MQVARALDFKLILMFLCLEVSEQNWSWKVLKIKLREKRCQIEKR